MTERINGVDIKISQLILQLLPASLPSFGFGFVFPELVNDTRPHFCCGLPSKGQAENMRRVHPNPQ
jgi:hypothetical protein